MDWKEDLDAFFESQAGTVREGDRKLSDTERRTFRFFKQIVFPALEELKAQLRRHGREVAVSRGDRNVPWGRIIVSYAGKEELNYEVQARILTDTVAIRPIYRSSGTIDGKVISSIGYFRGRADEDDIDHLTKDDIISDFLREYKIRVDQTRWDG